MDAAGPFLQFAQTLELLPVLRPFENVDVRFDIGQRLSRSNSFATTDNETLLRPRWRRHIAMNEMVNVMLGLAVFPLRRVNTERSFAERIGIALAQLGNSTSGNRSRPV